MDKIEELEVQIEMMKKELETADDTIKMLNNYIEMLIVNK